MALGDTFSLLGALFYALYAVFLEIKVPKEKQEQFSFSYFLGFVGLCNDFLLLPLFFVFNYTGLEPFEWPSRDTLILLTLNALVGTVLSDYCWARSVILLGPLVTTLGITLTFPIGLFVDIYFHGKTFSLLYLGGAILIFVAFGVIVFVDYQEEKRKGKNQQKEGNLELLIDEERKSREGIK